MVALKLDNVAPSDHDYDHNLHPCDCCPEKWGNKPPVTSASFQAVATSRPYNIFTPTQISIVSGQFTCALHGLAEQGILYGAENRSMDDAVCAKLCRDHADCKFYFTGAHGKSQTCRMYKTCSYLLREDGLEGTLFGQPTNTSRACRIADPDRCWATTLRRLLLVEAPSAMPQSFFYITLYMNCDHALIIGDLGKGVCFKPSYRQFEYNAQKWSQKRPTPASFAHGVKLKASCWTERYRGFNGIERVDSVNLHCLNGQWVNNYGMTDLGDFVCSACVRVGTEQYKELEQKKQQESYWLSKHKFELLAQKHGLWDYMRERTERSGTRCLAADAKLSSDAGCDDFTLNFVGRLPSDGGQVCGHATCFKSVDTANDGHPILKTVPKNDVSTDDTAGHMHVHEIRTLLQNELDKTEMPEDEGYLDCHKIGAISEVDFTAFRDMAGLDNRSQARSCVPATVLTIESHVMTYEQLLGSYRRPTLLEGKKCSNAGKPVPGLTSGPYMNRDQCRDKCAKDATCAAVEVTKDNECTFRRSCSDDDPSRRRTANKSCTYFSYTNVDYNHSQAFTGTACQLARSGIPVRRRAWGGEAREYCNRTCQIDPACSNYEAEHGKVCSGPSYTSSCADVLRGTEAHCNELCAGHAWASGCNRSFCVAASYESTGLTCNLYSSCNSTKKDSSATLLRPKMTAPIRSGDVVYIKNREPKSGVEYRIGICATNSGFERSGYQVNMFSEAFF
jgi:hypothetical protein